MPAIWHRGAFAQGERPESIIVRDLFNKVIDGIVAHQIGDGTVLLQSGVIQIEAILDTIRSGICAG